MKTHEKYLSEGHPKTKREIEWDKYLKQAGGDRQKAEEKWNKDHPFKHVSYSEIDKYKNLGTMNGWKKSPKELDRCEEKLHTRGARNLGRGYEEYYCPICKIRYQVDSSD